MDLLILDSTAKSLRLVLAEVHTTNPVDFTVHYADATDTSLLEANAVAQSNGVTNTQLLGGPAASTRRIIRNITICNLDTVSHVVKIFERITATDYQIFQKTLAAGEWWAFSEGAVSSGGASLADLGGGAETVGGAASNGTAVTGSRSDHKHAITAIAGYDLVSSLVNAEVSITGAVTATISKMHVISGTTADYTITLPPVSGNTGKLIGFRVSITADKLFTLDGDGTEKIDGELTRVIWAGESCILYCDGSNWFKITGKSIPMIACILSPTSQAIANITSVLINCTTSFIDNTGRICDTANKKLVVVRPGLYNVTICGQWESAATTGAQTICYKNNVFSFNSTGAINPQTISQKQTLAVSDYLTLKQYQSSGSAKNNYADGTQGTSITLDEIVQW